MGIYVCSEINFGSVKVNEGELHISIKTELINVLLIKTELINVLKKQVEEYVIIVLCY